MEATPDLTQGLMVTLEMDLLHSQSFHSLTIRSNFDVGWIIMDYRERGRWGESLSSCCMAHRSLSKQDYTTQKCAECGQRLDMDLYFNGVDFPGEGAVFDPPMAERLAQRKLDPLAAIMAVANLQLLVERLAPNFEVWEDLDRVTFSVDRAEEILEIYGV